MQVYSSLFLSSKMMRENIRVETLVCLEDIPHTTYDEPSFEKNLDYEVLGINWQNESYILMNDWGEAEEILIGDLRFKVDTYAPNKNYPTNFLVGIGMNQRNQWKWFS